MLPPRTPRWRRWLPAAAVVLLALVVGLVVPLVRGRSEVRLGRRVQLTLDPGLEIDPALSPDGGLVAFVAGPLGHTGLYVRQIDGGSSVLITSGAAGFARVPRWSPEGRRLLFRSHRGLEVVPALGGTSKVLLPIQAGTGSDGDWSPDGRSITYVLADSVYVRTLEGGVARSLARLADAHSCAWSPDGDWIACASGNSQFLSNEGFGNIAASSVWAIPAAGGAPIRVTDDQSLNTSPAWLPARGSLLYVSNKDGGRDIYQVALDRSGQPIETATRLTTGLNAVEVNVSTDGRRLAYADLTESSNVWTLPIPSSGIVSVSRAKPITRGNQVIEAFDVSSDGRWLTFDSDRDGTQQIYRVPLAGGEVEQLTSADEPALSPSFSPDGREIAYHSFRGGTRQVFVIPAEGGTPTQITAGSGEFRSPKWSPDGRTLAIEKALSTPDQEIDLVTRDARGHWGTLRALVKGASLGFSSPDGRSLLARREIGAHWLLEIVPASGGEGRTVLEVRDPATDVALGTSVWSADGRVVYFMGRDPRDQSFGIWSVPAKGGRPQLTVKFDDPTRPYHRVGFRVRGNDFYFTVGDRQSDVWAMELEGSR